MTLTFPPEEKVQELQLPDSPTDLDLTNDGELLAVAVRSGKGALIRVLHTKDGSLAAEYATDAAMGWGVAFLDGGRSLAYVVRDDDSHRHSLFRVQLDGGKPDRIGDWEHGDFNVSTMSRNATGTLYALNGDKTQLRSTKDDSVIREIERASTTHKTRSCFDTGDQLWVSGTETQKMVRFSKAGARQDALDGPGGRAASCEFVSISADDRYLVGLGTQGSGMAIYDLGGKAARRISKDQDDIYEWDEAFPGSAMVFSNDSSLAIFVTTRLEPLRLPQWALLDDAPSVFGPQTEVWWAASAREAPMMAFGAMGSNRVIWFPLVDS